MTNFTPQQVAAARIVFNKCMAKAALAAALASAGTFAGVELTTPPASVVAAPYVCPTNDGAGNMPTAGQCAFLEDVYDKTGVTPYFWSLPASKLGCEQLKSGIPASTEADNLYNSWQGQGKQQITLAYAQQYVASLTDTGLCAEYGISIP
jgi:hypothetical protein